MTRLRNRRLTGAVMVAVLMAGSLRGAGGGTDPDVASETRSAAASTSTVIQGQGWWKKLGCIGCAAGGLATTVVSGGSGRHRFDGLWVPVRLGLRR